MESKKHLLDLEGFDYEAFEFENEFSAKGILKAMDANARNCMIELIRWYATIGHDKINADKVVDGFLSSDYFKELQK